MHCSAPSGRWYVQPWTLTRDPHCWHRTLHPHSQPLKTEKTVIVIRVIFKALKTQTQYNQNAGWQWWIINAHKIKRWKRVGQIIIHQHLYSTIKQWLNPQRDLLQVGLCRTWQKVPSRIETFFDGLIKVEHYTTLSSSALYCTSQPTTIKTERPRDDCFVQMIHTFHVNALLILQSHQSATHFRDLVCFL